MPREDPYTIQAIGDLTLRLQRGRGACSTGPVCAVDRAVAEPNAESVAEAQIAVAESKILSTEIAHRCHQQAVRARRHPLDACRAQLSTATGATRAPTRCTIRCAGNTRSSATTHLNGVNPPLHAWS